jgi:hypothetical protein
VLSQVLPTNAADHGAPLCRDEPHVLLTASVLNAPSDTALQRVSVPLWSASWTVKAGCCITTAAAAPAVVVGAGVPSADKLLK